MKKFFSILSKVIITAVLLNAIFVTAKEKFPKNINLDNNEVAASEEYTNSNCVVYLKENGIKTFPFIFGNSIYLYSIDEDKTYLIACSKIPTFSYSPNMALSGKYLYYQKSDLWGNVTSTIYRRELKTSKVEKGKIDNDYDFIAIGESYFWTDVEGIYKYDTATNRDELFLNTETENQYSELRIIDKEVYALNEFEDSIDLISLDTKNIKKLPLSKGLAPGCIESLNKNSLIFPDIWSGKLMKYNLLTAETEEMACIVDSDRTSEEGWHCDKLKIYKERIYCHDNEYNIVTVNYNTGEKNTVIEINKYLPEGFSNKDINEWSYINYCKDYIVFDLSYSVEESKEINGRALLIFDYDGNLMKEVKLTPR